MFRQFHFTSALICALFSCAIVPLAAAAPKATIESDKLDLGTVKRGDVAKATIVVRNEGDAAFQILKIQSSCPCATAEQPTPETAVVKPGGQYIVEVKYDSKDRIGPQAAVIAVMTNDPANPALTVDLTVIVESLLIVRPPNGVIWGMSPRGKELKKTLEFAPGDGKQSIELLEISVQHPGVQVRTQKIDRGGENVIVAHFTLSADVPLGALDSTIDARVLIGGEEAKGRAPFHGDVIGEGLVSPPSIISPKTAYALGQRISEITVQSSTGGAAPALLGAMAVGPLRAVIMKTDDAKAHTIAVHVADDVPAGAQSGTVYVMTDSADQPITAIPVYFRAAPVVEVEPPSLILAPGESQTVQLSPVAGATLKIESIAAEDKVVSVTVERDLFASKESPAMLRITAPANPDPAMLTTIVAVTTDLPGGKRVHIPIAIRPTSAQ